MIFRFSVFLSWRICICHCDIHLICFRLHSRLLAASRWKLRCDLYVSITPAAVPQVFSHFLLLLPRFVFLVWIYDSQVCGVFMETFIILTLCEVIKQILGTFLTDDGQQPSFSVPSFIRSFIQVSVTQVDHPSCYRQNCMLKCDRA